MIGCVDCCARNILHPGQNIAEKADWLITFTPRSVALLGNITLQLFIRYFISALIFTVGLAVFLDCIIS